MFRSSHVLVRQPQGAGILVVFGRTSLAANEESPLGNGKTWNLEQELEAMRLA